MARRASPPPLLPTRCGVCNGVMRKFRGLLVCPSCDHVERTRTTAQDGVV